MMIRAAFCVTALFASSSPSFAQQPPGNSPNAPNQNTQGPQPPGDVPQLPPVIVTTPQEQPVIKPAPITPRVVRTPARARNSGGASASNSPGGGQASDRNASSDSGATGLAAQVNTLNAARENILPKIGVNSYELNRQAIEALPQGDNASLDKVLLQAPGVYQDSAASGNLHIRNEHANLQYRIDGILLPDGVSGFNQVLETSIIGNLAVVTGALPAQYGLRTAGLVDIQTRTGVSDPAGEIGVYGGSHGAFTTNLTYGGVSGDTEYFFTGRFLESDLGIENPTRGTEAIHDHTQQEKFFSYVSTVLPNNSRWTMITGASVGQYQIPDNPGQPQAFAVRGFNTFDSASTFDSARTNERQLEQNYYGVLAFQQTVGDVDYQLSYFSRYSSIHFSPDLNADLAFNGLASDVTRHSFLNGVQADGAWRVNAAHTLRAGVVVSAEQTYVTNASTVFQSDPDGVLAQAADPNNPNSPAVPIQLSDRESKTGWLAGVYMQDESRLTGKLTLNTGLRFDQMWQYVDANQLSPRAALVYKPFEGTVLHAGYARYFTPPPQAVGAPANYRLFEGTVAAAEVTPDTVSGLKITNALPERSNYYDAGITQRLAPGLDVGLDLYYKTARDLLDDGQFGAAYVLTAFNYEKAENKGLELKIKYTKDGLVAYGNLAWARQAGTKFVSNQYLQSLDDYIHALTYYIPTDHSQSVSASAGLSYAIWDHTKASIDMIYGGGLRNGDFNSTHLPGYAQFNLGLSHEFVSTDRKPFTVRFDVVNLFDHIYELRDGSGIGVFAPQYGPRRGFFVGLSQKF